jgi:hypothetical protein
MLQDSSSGIRQAVDTLLAEFLKVRRYLLLISCAIGHQSVDVMLRVYIYVCVC